MVRVIVKRGKEITPRRRAAIVTLRCLDVPMTFKKIHEITGVSSSTASDIWRHALENARNARLTATAPRVTSTASPTCASSTTSLPAPASLPSPTSLPESESDKEFTLMELISASILDSAPRSGRPTCMTEEDKNELVKFIKKDFTTRRMTLCDIRREAGLSHEQGIGAYQEVFKFILNKENQKKRLNYCEPRARWQPANEWADYAFTDEMSIEIGGLYGPCFVWREKDERWEDDCIGAMKKQGVSIMCWGMISYGWKGPFWVWERETEEEKAKATSDITSYNENCKEEESCLNTAWWASEEWQELRKRELSNAREARLLASLTGVKTKTTQSWRGKKYKIKKLKRGDSKGIDSWRYVTCLARPLQWPTWQVRKLVNPNFLLMEDNAPAHDSDFTNYEREKVGIDKVDWPPNSPDLNPIEHLWNIMKSRIQTQRGVERVTSAREMKLVLKQEWKNITIEDINREVSKLPNILAQCISQKEGE
ncbi:hypothetical protein L873DRAFT_1937458 [Choiromyces venosus 120613-1]|uniref:Tc1-like transposase DDE domain-containing protein n=1 Tax=Choiromyces venosus 120613-1 TaxID=1336337 RepID=A0A3N4JKC6_9PEZI|nr:hypothetical protein L873DRAFT_1937458 [Choiromyces venosus 120613-1]